MTDNLTKKQRSHCMSNIRSKWTTQERKIHNYLKGNKIKHKMHPKIEGSPDLVIRKEKKAVFLHGCFWHMCPRCYVTPKSNRRYWSMKIKANKERDIKNKKLLKKEGYNVITIWSHRFKKGGFKRIMNKLYDNPVSTGQPDA